MEQAIIQSDKDGQRFTELCSSQFAILYLVAALLAYEASGAVVSSGQCHTGKRVQN